MPDSHPYPDTSEPPVSPVPDTPLDAALLVVALRRLILAWRERGAAAPERESRIFRQVEADVTAVIAGHSEVRAIWLAARRDLVRAFVAALDEREGTQS